MALTAKLAVSWSMPRLTPAGIFADVVDPIGHGAAEARNQEIVHPHRFRLALRAPFAPAVLEIADQLLLLGVDRDRRLARRKRRLHLRVDVAELGVAVGMACPFAGLAVGLQAVAERAQRGPDRIVTDAVAERTQPRGQVAQALSRPLERCFRVAAGRRLDQVAQIVEQARVGGGERLAPAARPANPPRLRRHRIAQLGQASPDRAARNAGDARHRTDAAGSGRLRLGRRKAPPAPLIEHRLERLVAQA